ncbi:hypothetical protein PsalN5692_04002 (plasmid) [Piscirickettsia salmonis]|uniref:hypothetical protein n=1 Tax=Piscirickettsia salmonis TaxID=1238 RepID=UPI0012B9A73B|nr:hypothetical protein [Piscirickettsia salmonis]QGP52493.1 hypothetical protein PsalN5692_04002 [Piscirickettsia salmonis]
MLDTFSSRLRVCRTITGITGGYIVESINKKGIKLSARQYIRWEAGELDESGILKSDALAAIVDILNQHGLMELSLDWLLHGKGIPPFFVDMSNSIDEEKTFFIARCMGDDYKLIMIAGNYAEPYASPGDHIITKNMSPERLERKIAFIETDSHSLHVGIISNSVKIVTIRNDNESTIIEKSSISYSGRLVWVS